MSAVHVPSGVNQAFTTPTVPNEWYLPPAATGTNDTCLTASATTTQLPIPGCNLATVDASGSGTLRLTPNTVSKVGSTRPTPRRPPSPVRSAARWATRRPEP